MTLISGMTQAGLALLAKSQTGKKIFFTRMKIGNGTITDEMNFAELTDLINVIEAIEIKASEIIEQEDKTVALKVSSVAIQKDYDYYFREIGLFAIDPDTEEEILYAYINKGEEATYIPKSSSDISIQELATMIVAIGNENNIIVNCDSELRITEQIVGNGGYSLFDVVEKDHKLTFEESEGFSPLGTFVEKEGVPGESWGYADFVDKCLEEYRESTATRMTLGNSQIVIYVHSNDHMYYDIKDKTIVDNFYNAVGVAWFYGIDEENEKVFLPRNDFYTKPVNSRAGQYIAPQLPPLAHSHTITVNSNGSHNHTITLASNGAHTHTRGTMNITGQISGLSYDQSDSKNGMKGAFSWLSASKKGAASGESDRYASFNAANSWTGSTSSEGSHSHTVTEGSAGSHSHNAVAANSNATGNDYIGNTVMPPSVGKYFYMVTGNVRQKSAVVINAELSAAVESLNSATAAALRTVETAEETSIENIDIAKEQAISDLEVAANEELEAIDGHVEIAKDYSDSAKEYAETAEYYAGLATDGQLQTDWAETNINSVTYIKNKPNIDWENIVFPNSNQTLKNKIINGNNNTISNIAFNSLKSDVYSEEITEENISNSKLATSAAIYNLFKSSPFSDKSIITNLNNISNATDNGIPTALAVYSAINNVANFSLTSDDEVINVEMQKETNVSISSSNPNLTVTSSYEGTQNTAGTIIFNFTYSLIDSENNLYEWVNEANTPVNLAEYDLIIEGTPVENDVITVQYVTTSSNILTSNVSDVAKSGSYNDLLYKPVWGTGLKSNYNLVTTTSIEVTNENLEVTSSYLGTQNAEGIITYYFSFSSNGWVNEDEETINLADYDLTVIGSPEIDDIITLTYKTENQLTVSTNLQIPTKLSELTDNLGSNPVHTHNQYLTQHQDISGKANSSDLARVATTGNYNDLSNKPTKLSNFTDNLGSNPVHTHSQYLTEHQDISGKANSSDLARVATTGNYNDLTNKPTIPTVPTTLSSFTDNLGSNPVHTHSQYLTEHQDISGKANSSDLARVATTGNYNDLTNKPTIPTVPTTLSSFTDNLGSNPVHTHSQYQTKSNLVTSVSASSTDSQYASAKCIYNLIGNIETLLSEV